jgi:ElaB/YqjD/DUF883 family membrane-anchored ribosome-binding protein
MQTIENKDQFMREAQQLLQNIDEKINRFTSQAQGSQQIIDEQTSEEMNRLKNQRRNLQEALERYGNESDDNWMRVKNEAQYKLNEIHQNWLSGTAAAASAGTTADQDQEFGYGNTPEQGSKWTVSTGQSDRGGDATESGLGDRAGMEHPQHGLDNSTQYSSFGNPHKKDDATDEQLTRTNRGGDAAQPDPEGSAGKDGPTGDYNRPHSEEQA